MLQQLYTKAFIQGHFICIQWLHACHNLNVLLSPEINHKMHSDATDPYIWYILLTRDPLQMFYSPIFSGGDFAQMQKGECIQAGQFLTKSYHIMD